MRSQNQTGRSLLEQLQSQCGRDLSKAALPNINIDIVFVLDVTASMDPIIDSCKKLISEFDQYILSKIKTMGDRSCKQLRVKLVTYRDLYVEKDNYALDSSDFIILAADNEIIPEGRRELKERLSKIEICGGGDEPESGLEALALAMKSAWSYDSEKLRHIIVLFTDAPAHKLELVNQCPGGIPEWFPYELPENLHELVQAWNSDSTNKFSMEDRQKDRRLVLFTPDAYPWHDITKGANCTERTISTIIKRGNGGSDISTDQISDMLLRSVK